MRCCFLISYQINKCQVFWWFEIYSIVEIGLAVTDIQVISGIFHVSLVHFMVQNQFWFNLVWLLGEDISGQLNTWILIYVAGIEWTPWSHFGWSSITVCLGFGQNIVLHLLYCCCFQAVLHNCMVCFMCAHIMEYHCCYNAPGCRWRCL